MSKSSQKQQFPHIAQELRRHAVELKSLIPDPANLRVHGPDSIAALKASLSRFGQQKPIVFDANRVAIAGNGMLAAMLELGWTHGAAIQSGLEGIDRTLYAIADNRTTEKSEWAPELPQVLSDLGPELSAAVGFSADDIAELSEFPTEGEPADSEAASKSNTRAQRAPITLKSIRQVIVECDSEEQQRVIFERLKGEGLKCRVLTL